MTVVSATTQPFPSGWVSDRETVFELASRIGEITVLIGESIADLEGFDVVASNAVIELLEGLEKYRWMLLATTG